MGKKIRPEKLYSALWSKLCCLTPLSGDCGNLCGKACCRSEDADAGMYLFPGEEATYKSLKNRGWFRIEESNFEYMPGRNALIFICTGECDRAFRPLACRIFPLAPYKKEGERVRAIIDPRGTFLCPLANLEISDLDRDFVKTVRDVFGILSKFERPREFIYALSEFFDDLSL